MQTNKEIIEEETINETEYVESEDDKNERRIDDITNNRFAISKCLKKKLKNNPNLVVYLGIDEMIIGSYSDLRANIIVQLVWYWDWSIAKSTDKLIQIIHDSCERGSEVDNRIDFIGHPGIYGTYCESIKDSRFIEMRGNYRHY